MKLKPLQCVFASCSDASAETAEKSWFQTTPPYGEYPGGESVHDEEGNAIEGAVIVFDETYTDAIIAAFRTAASSETWPGILVDQEHYSLDYSKPSTALAWAKDIRRAADGSLWTRWEFTERGRELYEGKMLINRSPVLRLKRLPGKRFAPVELQSIGMTNTPHFKTLSPLAAAKANNQQKGTTMDPEILAALGLAADASKDEALAAIQQLKDKEAAATAKSADAEKKAQEAETEKDKAVAECRGMKADAFIAKNSAKIADAAAFREVYLANPELAEKTIAACKASDAKTAPTVTRIVAKDAKTPSGAIVTSDAKIAARNKAVGDYRTANGCSFQTAWAACRQADPELFAD